MTQRIVGRREVFAGVGGLLAAPAVVRAQSQSAGVALVIGNSKYEWETSLPNVKRDVADVARRFHALGLKTELLEDLRLNATMAALTKLAEVSRGAGVAAFYFAGHGVIWEGKTYVVSVDADLGTPSAAKSLVEVVAPALAMKQAGARLLVFDSCRNNPADGWRQRHARLTANMASADVAKATANWPNTTALFSTTPGGVALDGPAGQNSPFAAALLRHLNAPSVDLDSLGPKMRRDLLLATHGRQLMADYHGTFSKPVVLNASGPSMPVVVASYDPSKVVELPNTYAYVQKNNLYLPSGLIAYRPANSADAHRVGAYSFEFPASVSGLVAVTAMPDGNSAEIIWASKNTGTAAASGAFYRPATATRAGNILQWSDFNETGTFEFKWSDKDSGTFSWAPSKGGTGRASTPVRFTRLDG